MNTTVDTIKSYLGRKVRIVKVRRRPEDEDYYKEVEGFIEEVYPRTFVILRTDIDSGDYPQRTSYTYADLLMGEYKLEIAND
jgi:hypothetical protein